MQRRTALVLAIAFVVGLVVIFEVLFAAHDTAGAGATDHHHHHHHHGGGEKQQFPVVKMKTEVGTLVFRTRPDGAPETVANFLKLVRSGAYDGTSLYRGEFEPRWFVLQGGLWPSKGSPFPPVKLEYQIPNTKHTVCLGRTSDPNSGTSEFAVNLNDNSHALGPGGSDPYGYTVFAELIGGFDVVTAASHRPVRQQGGISVFHQPISILEATVEEKS